MFSKLTIGLAVTTSLMLSVDASAQTKKADPKKAKEAKAIEAKKAEEARLAQAQSAAKAEEEKKALEAQRLKEAEAAAEKAKTQDTSSFLGYMKSHFSASYHGEYYFARKDIDSANEKDHDIQDARLMHVPTIIYRPITNWKILATSEFKYTDAEKKSSWINGHYRSLVLLTRENILVEKEHGIKLDLGVGRRIFDRQDGKFPIYGNNRINASISKKISDKLSTSLFAQYLANDPAKGKIDGATWKHSLELIPSFTFQITDKISYFFNDDFIINTPWHNDTETDLDFSHEMNIGVVSYQHNDQNSSYLQLKYLHTNGAAFKNASKANDYFDYYLGHTYSFTPKVSITGEIGSTIFSAKDGRDFFAKSAKYPEFYVYFDWAL